MAVDSSRLICPHCATELEPGARFCGDCGRPIVVADPAVVRANADTLFDPAVNAAAIKAGVAAQRSMATASGARAPGGTAPTIRTPGTGVPHRGPGDVRPATEMTPRPVIARLDELTGRTLNNRYRVDRKIGEGGFGAVFKGVQIATGREVALKVLHPHNVGDRTVVARFRREAEACSRLRDPHTVITYDFDQTDDGILYLAMELLRGRSLDQIQHKEGPLSWQRTLQILDQVATALGEAHAQGIVHRDMKPENVIVEEREDGDFVKVLDFGIAKIVGNRNAPALTAIGQTVGTLEFMSPEQLRGAAIDGRSDIYALGMMAYEMLTGELPFKDAKSPTEVIHFHLQKPAPAPSQMRRELKIPSRVDALVRKMVAKTPDERYADADELRADIKMALQGHSLNRIEATRLAIVVTLAVAVIGGVVYFIGR